MFFFGYFCQRYRVSLFHFLVNILNIIKIATLLFYLQIAEELYQAGFISYPRTETDGFSVNTDLQVSVQFFLSCCIVQLILRNDSF